MNNLYIGWMIIISILVMYFLLSNVMIYKLDQINNNVNKVYMSLLMVSVMLCIEFILMIVIMKQPISYPLLFGLLLFSLFLVYLIRQQVLINDKQFLKSMIEHHSVALLMAEKILQKTKNPDITKLANQIYTSQTDEITLMKQLLCQT